jgi:multidrug resistance efflux pump
MTNTIAIAVAMGVLAGLGGRLTLRSNAGARSGEQLAAVDTTEQVAANGLVEGAQLEVRLFPEAPGILTAVKVRENDKAKKGQVLAKLSNQCQKAQVLLATAELALAREQLKKLENGERAQVRRRSKSEVQAKQSAFNNARREDERLASTRSGVSQSELDAASSWMSQAAAELDNAKADLALIEEGTRIEELEIARPQVEAAEARVQAAEADLAKTWLTAPTDCTVLRLFGEPEALVSSASKEPVMIVADLSKRRVRASVEELYVARVEVGQPAAVTADGLPGRALTGKVAVVLWRMGKGGPESDAPTEMKDMYFREVLVDLDGGDELPMNVRFQVRIQAAPTSSRQSNSAPGRRCQQLPLARQGDIGLADGPSAVEGRELVPRGPAQRKGHGPAGGRNRPPLAGPFSFPDTQSGGGALSLAAAVGCNEALGATAQPVGTARSRTCCGDYQTMTVAALPPAHDRPHQTR